METGPAVEKGAVRDLPIVAGHLALDFANTIDDAEGPARFDHIATFTGLLSWSMRAGALSPERGKRLQRAAHRQPRAAAAALRKAHVLRHVLSGMFTAVATHSGTATTYWAELHPFVKDAISHAEITPTTGAREYQLAWPHSDDFTAMLWPIAQAALALLTGPDLDRVKRCAGCPWLFLDQSRNASRRWCAMNDCGTEEKIRRYVARRAERRLGNR
jgi:predicted RNA-binding Zn ribbon-like protein